MRKFASIPADEGMQVLSQSATQIGGYDAVHQCWRLDGVKGESAIFVTAEVAALNDVELKGMVLGSPIARPETQCTLIRNDEGYTFINLNFES
jgi:hypothetical protein